MKPKILLITFSFFISVHAFSQKEANVWYFGTGAGLDFNRGNLNPILSGKTDVYEGCGTICTPEGRILFYTDGITVYDSTHIRMMPNGMGLKGDPSTTQSGLIVPRPDSSHLFYVFSLDADFGKDGLNYSVVNMKLNGGKGDVISTQRNIQLLTPVCEKISAVRHSNGRSYWVVVHKWKTDTIYAYHITSAGICKNPVKSATGYKLDNEYIGNHWGQMKISPNGKKIAYANGANRNCAVGDFNTTTGKVSNVWEIPADYCHGIEFSASSNFLYTGLLQKVPNALHQFDATATTRSEFINSKITIDSLYQGSHIGVMQLGPDGKIYLSCGKYLNVINAPDSAGKKCRFQDSAIYLNGRFTYLSLPGFVQSYLEQRKFYTTQHCFTDSVAFFISNTNKTDSVQWEFGDAASGGKNISKKMTRVYHVYSKPGYYAVKLIFYYKNQKESFTQKIYVKNHPKAFIGNDTTICNNFKLTFSPKTNYASYTWNTGSNQNFINIAKSGTYFLNAIDSNGCESADTLIIKNPIVVANFTVSDTVGCEKNMVFEFKETSTFTNDNKKQSMFYFFDYNSTDSTIKRSFPSQGKYTVKLIAESQEGCTNTKTRTIEVLSKTIANFKVNDVCENDSVSFINQSQNSKTYKWKFGDGEYSTKPSPKHFYSINGISQTFNVTLVAYLNQSCKDSAFNVVTANAIPKSDFIYNAINNKWNFTPTQSGNTKYRWLFGDGDSSLMGTVSHNYKDGLPSHTVCLKTTNAANCISQTCKQIATAGILYTQASGFKIYPNPNSGNFIIEIDNPEKDISVEVYNSLGELVKRVEMVGKVIGINLNVSPGIYLVKVRNGEVVYTNKVSITN